MPINEIDSGGTAVAREAVERVAHDPYIRHIVQLIDSGIFPEPAAAASLQEELFERMTDSVTDEETFNAHWA